jgi:hypothetical protein
MENFMKNEILQPIIETLQYKVNSTLGVFAKTFIERNDYETLGFIANIGIDLNTYIDGIFQTYSSPNAVIVINAEVVDETDETPTEATNKVAEVKVRQSPKKKFKFSVPNLYTKDWIFDYLGKRGGQSAPDDIYKDFFKGHKHLMTAEEIRNKLYIRHISRRVCEMRVNEDSKKNPINALIQPYTGKKTEYYALTKYGMELYQSEFVKALEKEAEKQKQYRQTDMDEMMSQG